MLPVFSKSSHAIFAAPFSRFLSCIIFPLRQRTSLPVGSAETQFLVRCRTSCPLSQALITLGRGEMSERICRARTVTEHGGDITPCEKGRAHESGPIISKRSLRPNRKAVPSLEERNVQPHKKRTQFAPQRRRRSFADRRNRTRQNENAVLRHPDNPANDLSCRRATENGAPPYVCRLSTVWEEITPIIPDIPRTRIP